MEGRAVILKAQTRRGQVYSDSCRTRLKYSMVIPCSACLGPACLRRVYAKMILKVGFPGRLVLRRAKHQGGPLLPRVLVHQPGIKSGHGLHHQLLLLI